MNAEARLYADLDALGIDYRVHEHPPVFTVEESGKYTKHIAGAHTKNLFLEDRDGRFWLLTVSDNARIDLKALPRTVECSRVSFGKAEVMARLLGVTPGSVTALAAINDSDNCVRLILDARLAEAHIVNCHPLRNNATLSLAPADLVRALAYWNHDPIITSLPLLESL